VIIHYCWCNPPVLYGFFVNFCDDPHGSWPVTHVPPLEVAEIVKVELYAFPTPAGGDHHNEVWAIYQGMEPQNGDFVRLFSDL
jgi:hypothetical protein